MGQAVFRVRSVPVRTEPWPLQAHLTLGTVPFRHFLFDPVLTFDLLDQLADLRVPPSQCLPSAGRRETNNTTRRYFDASLQSLQPACAAVARRFQSPWLIDFWHSLCGANLKDCFLRIEYCQDTDGFWLEPHTDIGAKRLTMLIYLTTPPYGEDWGTDLLFADGTLARRIPAIANTGWLFVPGADTWHGFAPRPITGTRRSLIVNYVGPEWRARHELCFPGQTVL